MAKVTITLSDEDDGFDMSIHTEFDPPVAADTPPEKIPTPHIAAVIALNVLNQMSESGGPDYIEADGEVVLNEIGSHIRGPRI